MEKSFSSLGPALRLLGLVLLLAAVQSARGVWAAAAGLVTGQGPAPLPGGADIVIGLLAIGVGAFFLRHAGENAQALAGGGRVLPPLTLLRLVQPRFEHPLRELWSRSDPGIPLAPMPESRLFGAVWGLGLAVAIPLWSFALTAGVEGRVAMALDVVHHAAMGVACWLALHFAAAMARRQDEAWERVKPPLLPATLRVVKPAPPVPSAAEPVPAPAQGLRRIAPPKGAPSRYPPNHLERADTAPGASPSRYPPNHLEKADIAPARPPPPPQPAAPRPDPTVCPLCQAKLSGRRCDACGAPALAASFRIVKSLGGAGARRTYLAEAPDGARVVLKELAVAAAPDAQALDAFAREARTLRELKHPRLPAYVDAFREEDGPRARLYLAYRYLEGVSLAKEMEERRYTEPEVLDLIEEVLEILRHLHGLQPPLIHRDLKPSNLIRRPDGSIALIDFGVSRDLSRTVNSGTLVGTVGYMPPEQLAGQVDLTCDLYALGATALHLLTRVPPWEFMDGPELKVPPLKTAPVARAFLQRMLAFRRARRFASAREALAALKRLRTGGVRLPRVGVAAAGVAAATVVAAALGAGRRAGVLPQPAHPIAQSAPAPAQRQPMTVPAVPLTAPPPAPVSWKGGSLSRAEIEESLRALPPWLKSDQPWWIQQHLFALAKRKFVAAEAERRGFAVPPGPDRERRLARALLASDAPPGTSPRSLYEAWQRLTAPLAEVRLDEAQVFGIEPLKFNGPLPRATDEAGEPAAYTFMTRTGLCTVEVEPSLHRYGGRCEGASSLSLALLEPDTLAMLDLAPSPLPDRFYARYSDDFVEGAQLASADGLVAAHLAERALSNVDIRLSGVTGTASFGEAQSLVSATQLALRRCLAVAMLASPLKPSFEKAHIEIELRPGAMPGARIDTDPRIAASGCARILARPELSGAGTVSVNAVLLRAVESARPAVAPAVHPPEPAEDDE